MPISKETTLTVSDTAANEHPAISKATISLSPSMQIVKGEADQLYNGLSADGRVTMPMNDTFRGSYFGMFIDKLGISWMVSFNDPAKAPH